MLTHNIDPVLTTILSLEIRYYGIVYALGFVLTLLWLLYFREKLNLTKDEIYDLVFYSMLGVIIGGRLFHVIFWEPSYYLSQPWKILFLWEGGMAYHGGLVGVIVAGWIYCKKKSLSFLKLADFVSIPAVFGLALGRLANFTNAELYGPITNVAWCFDFGDGLCRHPYQLYAAAKRFAIAGVLAGIFFTKKTKEGFLFWMMIFLMGIGRLFLDFYRDDPFLILGLSMGQWMSLAMALVSGYILWKKYKKDLKSLFSKEKKTI
jgi:phosphatidylglycerol---prolipoprotein diacylglyceryl transferase